MLVAAPYYQMLKAEFRPQYSGILIEKMRKKHEDARPKMTCTLLV